MDGWMFFFRACIRRVGAWIATISIYGVTRVLHVYTELDRAVAEKIQ